MKSAFELTGNMHRFSLNSIVLVTAFGIGLSSTVYAEDQATQTTEVAKLKKIREALRSKPMTKKFDTERAQCPVFMNALLQGSTVKVIEPIAYANSFDDPELKVWHSCDAKNGDDLIDTVNPYNSTIALEGPPYRYYKIELDGNPKNGKEDVIYHEHSKEYSYASTGYTWVDLKACDLKTTVEILSLSLYGDDSARFNRINLLIEFGGKPYILDLQPKFVDSNKFELELTALRDSGTPRFCVWTQ